MFLSILLIAVWGTAFLGTLDCPRAGPPLTRPLAPAAEVWQGMVWAEGQLALTFAFCEHLAQTFLFSWTVLFWILD